MKVPTCRSWDRGVLGLEQRRPRNRNVGATIVHGSVPPTGSKSLHMETERQRGANTDDVDQLTRRIIGFAIDVHRHLGPGLLESAYEVCLCHDLREAGLAFARQVPLPIRYRGVTLDCGYRMDLVVADQVIIEIKALDKLAPIHEAQLLTYLRLSGLSVGLLMNFNMPVLKDGLRRLNRSH